MSLGVPAFRRLNRDRAASSSSWRNGRRSLDPPAYALASQCLRAVLERQPDHREARRLLGYVPYEGGWARPFAVEQLRNGYVSHPIFGWVQSEWVPHPRSRRTAGPARQGTKQGSVALRRRGQRPSCQLVSPLAHQDGAFRNPNQRSARRGDQFWRRLEAFHDVFMGSLRTFSATISPWSAASRIRR